MFCTQPCCMYAIFHDQQTHCLQNLRLPQCLLLLAASFMFVVLDHHSHTHAELHWCEEWTCNTLWARWATQYNISAPVHYCIAELLQGSHIKIKHICVARNGNLLFQESVLLKLWKSEISITAWCKTTLCVYLVRTFSVSHSSWTSLADAHKLSDFITACDKYII